MKKISTLALVLCTLCIWAIPALAWQPSKDVEFIVPSAPGGGSDLNARTIADIATQEKFIPVNLMVVNKPGGSGAVSFAYVGAKKGDNSSLMVLHNGQGFGSYVLNWDVKVKDLTILGTVAFDPQILCAVAGSEFTDLKKTIALSKEKRVTYGGSNKGNTDHLSYITTNRETGSEFKYVMFNSSGEVVAAMLGGHVNLGVLNPSECIGQIRAGKLVPLGVYADRRASGELSGVPTFSELGYAKLVTQDARAIAGPPNMSPEAIAFYEGMLKKVTETPRWQKDYIEKNFLTPVFLDAKTSHDYLIKESAEAMERFKADETMSSPK